MNANRKKMSGLNGATTSSCASARQGTGLFTRARGVIVGLALTSAALLFVAQTSAAKKPRGAGVKPRATSAQIKNTAAGSAAGKTRFTLVLGGAGFGSDESAISVNLLSAPGSTDALEKPQKILVADKQVVVEGESAPGTYTLVVKKGDKAVDTSKVALLTVPAAPAVAAATATATPTPAPAPTPAKFFVEFETQPYPLGGGFVRHGLIVTSDGGNFDTDPRLMSVQITPPGASDVSIRRATPSRIDVDFFAPDTFKVKGVDVTVFDSADPTKVAGFSTLVDPNVAQQAQAKSAAAALQPEITSTEVVFLRRDKGFGRLKIEGKSFGDYERPPLTAEEFLMSCQNLSRDTFIKQYPDGDARIPKSVPSTCAGGWKTWQEKINQRVKVALVPRNIDLRIEQTQVLYIDDKLIDVYFEFDNFESYSEPFRLARTTVTVKKDVSKKKTPGDSASAAGSSSGASSTISSSSISAAGAAGDTSAACVECKTFIATKDIGLPRDDSLEYRYTVLDDNQAKRLFGSGVAGAYHVIQLAVTNKGAKKVAVPLSSIEAEIEWAFGDSKDRNIFYEQGPPTIAPQTLAAVTGFFDADNKVNGKAARLFNIFDGMTTLGTSLIPLFGPGFQDAHSIFTGGLIPGTRKVIGDLSGQQLQNLAAMSWQNVEVISASGGSVNKFVFVQRGIQGFGAKNGEGQATKKEIKNIRGVEVVGYEVVESTPKVASPAK